VPQPVHVADAVALVGTETALQLLVQVAYFPLQHFELNVAVPFVSSVHVHPLAAVHLQRPHFYPSKHLPILLYFHTSSQTFLSLNIHFLLPFLPPLFPSKTRQNKLSL
jgi:hypothetical protein